MMNKNSLFNASLPLSYWIPWMAKDIIPPLFSFPALINIIGYIFFYSRGGFLLPLDESIIALILSVLLYLYHFIFKRAEGKATKIATAIIFSGLFFVVAFSINSYNELFNEFIITSKTKVDFIFLIMYFFCIFEELLAKRSTANENREESFLSYKMPTKEILFFAFSLFLLYSYIFTDSFNADGVKCEIDSDCPILENNPDGNWNCENFCGAGTCQFKCVQKSENGFPISK